MLVQCQEQLPACKKVPFQQFQEFTCGRPSLTWSNSGKDPPLKVKVMSLTVVVISSSSRSSSSSSTTSRETMPTKGKNLNHLLLSLGCSESTPLLVIHSCRCLFRISLSLCHAPYYHFSILLPCHYSITISLSQLANHLSDLIVSSPQIGIWLQLRNRQLQKLAISACTKMSINQTALIDKSLIFTPSPGRGTGYCFRAISFSFFVSLSATLRENGWSDLHEIFREGVE